MPKILFKKIPQKISYFFLFSILALALGAFLFISITKNIQAKKEAEITNALAIFQHPVPENLKWEEENGSYKVSQDSNLFTPYQASFSLEGVTFQRNDSSVPLKLDFFGQNKPQKMEKRDNRILYYFSDFLVVYSPTKDELKNDVIFFKKPKNGFSLSWQINSNNTLEARQKDNGDVEIYGSDKFWQKVESNDPALIQEIQEKSEKTKLLYTVKAPYIIEANGTSHQDLSFYETKENILTLKLKDNLPNLVYPISIDPTVSYGSEYAFNQGSAGDYTATARLDATHFVMVYVNTNNGSYGTAIIGTISGTTITYGSEYVFNSAATEYLSVSVLDATHFVAEYSDLGNGYYGTAIIGIVSGSTITYGAESVFNAGVTTYTSVSALDATHFVVGYKDNGNSNYGTAIIGVVSGSTITYGAESVFNAANTSYTSVSRLDATHFVAGYSDLGNSYYGTAIIGIVSGSTITYGSESVFNVAATYDVSVSTLDSTHFVAGYSDSNYYGTAIIGIISGTSTIAYGSEYVFNAATVSYPSVSALDTTHFVAGYRDGGNSTYGTAIIGTISGTTTITYGSEYVFNAARSDYVSVSALDATHFVAGYKDFGNSSLATAAAGTVSGNVIAYGSEYVFNKGSVGAYAATARLDATHFVMVYKNTNNGSKGTAVIGTISAGAISYGSEYVFTSEYIEYLSVSALDATHFVAGYKDYGNGTYGTAIIGAISGTVITYGSGYVFNTAEVYYLSVSALDSTHFVAGYRDIGNSSYGTAIIGTVSGYAITYGSEYAFNAGVTDYISISRLDATHFVAGYRDNSNSSYGTAIIGIVSSSTISYGSEYVFNTAQTNYVSVSTLDSTHFVVGYMDFGNSSKGTAIIGIISGTTTITYGSEYVFNAASTVYTSVSALDSTHFVAGYSDEGNSVYGTAIIGIISTTTITYGSEYVFNSGATSYTSVSALDSTHFVAGYQDTGNNSLATAAAGTITSGTVIAYGSEYQANTGATEKISISRLDATHFVAGYKDTGSSNYGTAIIGTISGTAITYGSEYVFNAASTYYPSVSALDATHFVAGYRDDGNSNYGTAIIGTISGTTITYGSEYVFNTANTGYIPISALDSTHFVAGYADYGNSGYGTAIIGIVSGTTIITYGSEYVFNAGGTDYISISRLDATHFVVGYMDTSNSNKGTAIVSSVSGNVIAYGSEYIFNAASTDQVSLSALDSTHFVAGYRDNANSSYGTAIIGIITGTSTIAYGSEYVFNAGNTDYLSVSSLDATHFVAGYRDGGNSSYGTAIIGTISGTAISYGSEYVFNTANSCYISVSLLDATHFVAGYNDVGNSSYGTAIVSSVSGNVIAYGAESLANSGITTYPSVSRLDATHFVAGYMDTGNGSYGTAVVGTISSSTITYGSEYVFNSAATLFYLSVSALDSTHFVAGYRDEGNSSYGTAIIGTISGSTITYGLEYVFNAGLISSVSVSALDSTHFVVGYAYSSGIAIIGTVSGTTITYGSKYVFNTAVVTEYVSVSPLDATHFVAGYRDTSNSGYGTAIIGIISGTSTIAYGSEYVFNAAQTYYPFVSALDSTHFVAGYMDNSNSSYGTAIIGIVSGTTTITYGSEYVFNAGVTDNVSVSRLDATHFVAGYKDVNNSNSGTAIIGTVSSSAITYGSEDVFNTAQTYYPSVSALDATHFVVGYNDVGNGQYGTAVVGTFTPPVPPTVTTQAAANITPTQATGNGNITDIGSGTCDKRGFVYGTASTTVPGNVAPTSSGYALYVEDTGSFAAGAFTKTLINLSGSTYYVRAYAHNSSGYAYGNEVNFLADGIPSITSVSISTANSNICRTVASTTVCQSGQTITFESTAPADPDAGDTIKLYVCKAGDCANCQPGTVTNCWAVSATASSTNPSANYNSSTAGCGGSSPCEYCASCSYYAKVCDSYNSCSEIIGGE